MFCLTKWYFFYFKYFWNATLPKVAFSGKWILKYEAYVVTLCFRLGLVATIKVSYLLSVMMFDYVIFSTLIRQYVIPTLLSLYSNPCYSWSMWSIEIVCLSFFFYIICVLLLKESEMCDRNFQRYNKNGLTIESDHYLCFQSPMWKNVIKNLDLKVMVSTMHYKTMLEREILFLKRPKEFGKWITENQQRSQTWYSLLFAFRIVMPVLFGLLCFNSHVIWGFFYPSFSLMVILWWF